MPAGREPEERGFRTLRRDGLALVLAPRPARGGVAALVLGRGAKQAALRAMRTRQMRLEQCLEAGDVLPAAPGAPIRPDDAEEALITAAPALRAGLAALAGRAQMQISVGAPAGGPIALATLSAEIEEAVATTCEDAIALPRDAVGAAANIVCLGTSAAFVALERALEALDGAHGGELRIRMTGPLPAVSFLALRIERPARRALAGAAALLGVEEGASRAAVEAAHRRAARDAHPDLADVGAQADLGALRAARELLVAVAEAREALRRAGRTVPAAPPLARLVRDGREPVRLAQASAGEAA